MLAKYKRVPVYSTMCPLEIANVLRNVFIEGPGAYFRAWAAIEMILAGKVDELNQQIQESGFPSAINVELLTDELQSQNR